MSVIRTVTGESLAEEASRQVISERDKKRLKQDILTSALAAAFLLAALCHERFFPSQAAVTGLLYFAGACIIGLPILKTAVTGLLRADMSASMEILVSIAMIMEILSNEYVLAILIPIILTLVHFLEEKSIMGGRDAIEGLKKFQAATALLLEDGVEKEVDAGSLKKGDQIVLKAGMSLPIDGVVVSGFSSMDQKSLTGESIPASVGPGDKVFAGTINMEGVLKVEVVKEMGDTAFQQIVKLLENAENITIPETKIVDVFMGYYIPLVLIIATLVWLLTQDINKAIAILVVSCPCGYLLVSSAPMIAALGAASKRGLLIKNSAFIEKLSEAECLIFDKTGTITKGDLEVTNYYLDKAKSYEELLSAAAALTHKSLHPVSKSITQAASSLDYPKDYQVKELIGKGVEGEKEGSRLILGNRRYILSLGYDIPDRFEKEGAASWIVKDGDVLGCLVLRDSPREDAPAMVSALKKLGVRKTCILTGDNDTAARRVTASVNIDSVYSELLPEQKLEHVKKLKESYTVGVIGDGINDALALSEADVGIAMGAMGSDTAIQSADIALMNNNLENIPYAIRLSRKTKKIIFQNIIIAFVSSFIMIFLASVGIISAMAGAILHNFGAFAILLNSGRLLRQK